MLKLASLSLAALLTLSPVLAQDAPTPPKSASCFPLELTVQSSPAKETSRITGDAVVKFKEAMDGNMTKGSDPLPAAADTVVFFRLDKERTAFALANGNCTLGTGIMDTRLVPGEKSDDGSI